LRKPVVGPTNIDILNALPSDTFKKIEEKEHEECMICKMDFDDIDLVTVLPCNIKFFWLI